MLPNISEYLGQTLDIFIFQILYFRLPKLPSLFSLLTTFGHFGAYGHFFIERIIAKAFGDSLKTIMGIYQLYTWIFVHYQIWLFWGEGGFLWKSKNINQMNNSRRYHASEPLTRVTFETKKEIVQKHGVQALHNVFIRFFIAFLGVHFHAKMVISFKPLEIED